jgi:uncharacterized BrkB/YihY/UPF0761 family membrane protein
VAAALFVLLGQVFPLYLWLVGGVNRYGVAFGLVSLLVTWFAALGHVLLFGRLRQRHTHASIAARELTSPALMTERSRKQLPGKTR